ncbi:MAG TPA: transglycosylase SLT domain-containing protein [Candidatus Sulfotelmatobacter sp.]|nr:transglycosylase SLT domain-containing protein [Candidatus Sulfotelmatobacter sp.]
MRLAVFEVRIATLASLLAAGCACQTAQKPVSLLPPASAPALQPAAPPQAKTQSSQPPISQIPQTSAEPQQQESPAPAPAAQGPDPVADLITRVEMEYQAGLANYHAGKSDDAKKNFDNAMNALLDSKFDVRSDQRLQQEFDRVVQGVNEIYPGGTEGDAQQADAQQEPQQKSEPAPIDETNQLAPSADARTKAKAEAEVKNTHSDLPLMMTDQVAGYIAYFQGRGRGIFERALSRSGRYHDMIIATLKDEGVPQDLIYLAQAESGFHPLAVSRAGARGIWQFMASRARGYGLSHNMWVDDRQDPVKSTRAAAQHLKDLYAQFGDWYLAMAAYNSGPGTVQAAVKRTGYADFWELYRRNVLPKETRNYVPIILAVTIMAKNPSQYGLESVVMENPPDYDTVTINYPVDLRLVAQCVNSTAAELQDLNPSLLRLSTPREGKFELHIPAGTKEDYQAAIAEIPVDKRLWWRYHSVHAGDTVVSLAHSYRVTARAIIEANHLDGPLEANSRIVIPLASGQHSSADVATYSRRITRYKVRRGDTVETVAENFGVSPQQLRRWNGLRGNTLAGRKVLALHLPISPSARDEEAASPRSKHPKTETAIAKPPATKSAEIERLKTAEVRSEKPAVVHHKVKSGETLSSIANLYKTTVTALKRDNRNVAVLHPGMILTVQLAR